MQGRERVSEPLRLPDPPKLRAQVISPALKHLRQLSRSCSPTRAWAGCHAACLQQHGQGKDMGSHMESCWLAGGEGGVTSVKVCGIPLRGLDDGDRL